MTVPHPYVPVTWALKQADLLRHFCSISTGGTSGSETLMGVVRDPTEFVAQLVADARFANGVFYQLHRDDFDPSADLTEFRSHPGALVDCRGSLQVVVDRRSGTVYADVDRYSPYADVVNALGHLFGEVLWNRIRRRRA